MLIRALRVRRAVRRPSDRGCGGARHGGRGRRRGSSAAAGAETTEQHFPGPAFNRSRSGEAAPAERCGSLRSSAETLRVVERASDPTAVDGVPRRWRTPAGKRSRGNPMRRLRDGHGLLPSHVRRDVRATAASRLVGLRGRRHVPWRWSSTCIRAGRSGRSRSPTTRPIARFSPGTQLEAPGDRWLPRACHRPRGLVRGPGERSRESGCGRIVAAMDTAAAADGRPLPRHVVPLCALGPRSGGRKLTSATARRRRGRDLSDGSD